MKQHGQQNEWILMKTVSSTVCIKLKYTCFQYKKNKIREVFSVIVTIVVLCAYDNYLTWNVEIEETQLKTINGYK